MTLGKSITQALKEGRVLFGVKSARKAMQEGKAEIIVVAENCPEDIVSDFKLHSEISEINLQVFDGSNVELGTHCKKPFPVSVLVVKSK